MCRIRNFFLRIRTFFPWGAQVCLQYVHSKRIVQQQRKHDHFHNFTFTVSLSLLTADPHGWVWPGAVDPDERDRERIQGTATTDDLRGLGASHHHVSLPCFLRRHGWSNRWLLQASTGNVDDTLDPQRWGPAGHGEMEYHHHHHLYYYTEYNNMHKIQK